METARNDPVASRARRWRYDGMIAAADGMDDAAVGKAGGERSDRKIVRFTRRFCPRGFVAGTVLFDVAVRHCSNGPRQRHLIARPHLVEIELPRGVKRIAATRQAIERSGCRYMKGRLTYGAD